MGQKQQRNKNYFLSFDERQRIAALYNEGLSNSKIAKTLNRSVETIVRELERGNTGQEDMFGKPEYDPALSQRRLLESRRKERVGFIYAERQKIERLYLSGMTQLEIAKEMGCDQSTIARELAIGYTGQNDKNDRREYDPLIAQRNRNRQKQRRAASKSEETGDA